MEKIKKLIELMNTEFPDSKLDKVREIRITEIENKYGEIPTELKEFYRKNGYGTIGDSALSIHALLEPDEIYDNVTALELKGKLIVGDNFSGDCYAYDTENEWNFGFIDAFGEFIELKQKSFTDFLYDFCETGEYFSF